MSENTSTISNAIKSTTSSIEKSIEFKYLLVLGSFVLLLDNCLVVFYKKNIFDSFKSLSDPEVSIGNILFFMVLFSFLMSVFFKTLRRAILLLTLPFSSTNEYSDNFVSIDTAEKEAIMSKDDFTLSYIKEQQSAFESLETYLDICFGMIILSIFNFFILGNEKLITSTQFIYQIMDSDYNLWLNILSRTLITAVGFFVLLLFLFCIRQPERIIYLPKDQGSDESETGCLTKNSS